MSIPSPAIDQPEKQNHPRFSRYAGLLEQYHIARASLGLDSCLISAVRYKSRDGSHLKKSLVYRALKQVVEVHVAMCLRVHYERSQKPYFSFLETLNFDEFVEFTEGGVDTIQALMEEEFRIPFDIQKDLPLWRLKVLSDDTVLFMYSHGLGDGLSGLAFHDTFFDSLLSLRGTPSNQDTEDGMYKIPSTMKQVKAMDDLINLSVPIKTLLPALIGTMIKSSNNRTWTGDAVPKDFDYSNRVRILTLSPKTVERLLSKARASKATLSSVICLSVLSALSSQINETTPNSRYKSTKVSIPVSLRKLANLPQSTFGDLVSGVSRDMALIKEDFDWSAASKLSKDIRESVPKTPARVGLLKYINGKYEKYYTDKLGQERGEGVEISNLGLFQPDSSRISAAVEGVELGWKIEEMYFAQDNAVIGSALNLNVVGSPNGSVSICLTWGKRSVDDRFAEAFLEKLRNKLEGLVPQG